MPEVLPEAEMGRQVRYVLDETSPNRGEIRTAQIVFVHETKPGKPQLVNLNVAIGKPSDLGSNQGKAPNLFVAGAKLDQDGKSPATFHWTDRDLKLAAAQKKP